MVRVDVNPRGADRFMMPVGPILLVILLVLIAFGFGAEAVHRLGLAPAGALVLVGGMLLGSLVDVPIAAGLAMNLGGALIPLGVALFLLVTAEGWKEAVRSAGLAVAVGGAVYLAGRWFPPGTPTELNLFYLDAQYLYELVAAVVAGALARTPRAAFSAAALGVVGADFAYWAGVIGPSPDPAAIGHLGGTGFHGTALVAAVVAAALAHWLGVSVTVVRGAAGLSSRRP